MFEFRNRELKLNINLPLNTEIKSNLLVSAVAKSYGEY
jgi:hypothetical protein